MQNFRDAGSSAIDHYEITYPMYNNAENSYTMDEKLRNLFHLSRQQTLVESDFSHCGLDEYDLYLRNPDPDIRR